MVGGAGFGLVSSPPRTRAAAGAETQSVEVSVLPPHDSPRLQYVCSTPVPSWGCRVGRGWLPPFIFMLFCFGSQTLKEQDVQKPLTPQLSPDNGSLAISTDRPPNPAA